MIIPFSVETFDDFRIEMCFMHFCFVDNAAFISGRTTIQQRNGGFFSRQVAEVQFCCFVERTAGFNAGKSQFLCQFAILGNANGKLFASIQFFMGLAGKTYGNHDDRLSPHNAGCGPADSHKIGLVFSGDQKATLAGKMFFQLDKQFTLCNVFHKFLREIMGKFDIKEKAQEIVPRL